MYFSLNAILQIQRFGRVCLWFSILIAVWGSFGLAEEELEKKRKNFDYLRLVRLPEELERMRSDHKVRNDANWDWLRGMNWQPLLVVAGTIIDFKKDERGNATSGSFHSYALIKVRSIFGPNDFMAKLQNFSNATPERWQIRLDDKAPEGQMVVWFVHQRDAKGFDQIGKTAYFFFKPILSKWLEIVRLIFSMDEIDPEEPEKKMTWQDRVKMLEDYRKGKEANKASFDPSYSLG